MSQRTLNTGAAPDNGLGTPLRTAFAMVSDDFRDLYLTGTSLQTQINTIRTISGDFGNQFYPLTANPSGYITASQTGAFAHTPISFNDQATTGYTLTINDAYKMVVMNHASGNQLTVPTAASVTFITGTSIDVEQHGAGQTTITGASGVSILSRGGANKIAGQYGTASLVYKSLNTWLLIGDLTT